MEIYSAIKNQNIAICSNMDTTRGYHTKWSKSEKDNIGYQLYVEYKIWHKWAYLQNRNRFIDIENRLVVAKGDGAKQRDGLGVWGW